MRKRFAFTDILVIICDIIIIVVHFRTHAVCCAARVHAEIAFFRAGRFTPCRNVSLQMQGNDGKLQTAHLQHAAQAAPSISAKRLLSLYTRNMGLTRP